jgi:hypothetical protein
MPTINIAPQKVKIRSLQGTDIPLPVIITQNSLPVNIAGYDFDMDIITAGGVVIQSLSVGSGITVINAANGYILLGIEGDTLVFDSRGDVQVFGTLWVTDTDDERRAFVQFCFVLASTTPSDCGGGCGNFWSGESDLIVEVPETTIEVQVNAYIPPTDAQIIEALNSLPEYDSDESAIDDGLSYHDPFWHNESSTAGLPGFLKRVTIV